MRSLRKKTGNSGKKNSRSCAAFVLILAFLLLSLSGCGSSKDTEASGSNVFFDTVVDIRIFGSDADRLLKECFEICENMENTLSAHKEESELYKLNHRTMDQVEVSDDLAAAISYGLTYGELSDGAFDITILPLRTLWNFESDKAAVPSEEEIQEALKKVDYRKVHVNGNTVSFDDPETEIDLGGIAKGYISAKLKAYLKEQGCTSALLNLGGNVSALGAKPDGSPWKIGLQEPFAEKGTAMDTVEIENGCVITSGIYERYFEENGILYHHILDPKTGYPAETDLEMASVTGEDDILCDAFSTICIVLGKEASVKLADEQGWKLKLYFVDDAHTGEWITVGSGASEK
ncbi:MAG: FAD:protein FMN transferase [Eubacterium sp.]|nr:FAD:protein FMN transferase [Eubacterium sp.]